MSSKKHSRIGQFGIQQPEFLRFADRRVPTETLHENVFGENGGRFGQCHGVAAIKGTHALQQMSMPGMPHFVGQSRHVAEGPVERHEHPLLLDHGRSGAESARPLAGPSLGFDPTVYEHAPIVVGQPGVSCGKGPRDHFGRRPPTERCRLRQWEWGLTLEKPDALAIEKAGFYAQDVASRIEILKNCRVHRLQRLAPNGGLKQGPVYKMCNSAVGVQGQTGPGNGVQGRRADILDLLPGVVAAFKSRASDIAIRDPTSTTATGRSAFALFDRF